jgi:hypothetical protein
MSVRLRAIETDITQLAVDAALAVYETELARP